MPVASRGERRIHWDSAGDGPAVLLVPGTGAGARQFGTLPRRFARRGFRCLTTSPVGVPPSSPLAGAFSFHDAALDLVAVLDAAGVETCVAVGTSLGGKVALQAAALCPARWPRLVMLASAASPSARAGHVYRFFELVATRLPAGDLGRAVAPFLFGRTLHEQRPELIEDILRGMRPDPAARALMAAQARALLAFDGTALARRVTCPVLCLAGREDTLTPPQEVAATAALLAGGRYREIPAAGHSLLLESAEAFEEVARFAAEPAGPDDDPKAGPKGKAP